MAKLRERTDQQIEVILERRHVVLLGFCALVLGSLLFLLGMLTQKSLMSAPATTLVAEVRKESSPPTLFPNRSTQPIVREKNFEFYDTLNGGKNAKDKKAGRERKNGKKDAAEKTAAPARKLEEPAVPVVASAAKSELPGAAKAPARTAKAPESRASAPESTTARAESSKPAEPKVEKASLKPKAETPAAKAPRKETPSAKADKNGQYTLQVAALSDQDSAQSILKRLRSKGFPAFLDRARLDNGKLVFRVKVGSYTSKDKAQQIASQLEAEVGRRVWVQKAAEG